MFFGASGTCSVTQTAFAPASGIIESPKTLVVLVKMNASTPAATDSSSKFSVPVTLVSIKSCAECVTTCGLCSVAGRKTSCTPRMQRRINALSAIEPVWVVNGDSRMSRPTTSRSSLRNIRTSASPRWPALPVTKTRIRIYPKARIILN